MNWSLTDNSSILLVVCIGILSIQFAVYMDLSAVREIVFENVISNDDCSLNDLDLSHDKQW